MYYATWHHSSVLIGTALNPAAYFKVRFTFSDFQTKCAMKLSSRLKRTSIGTYLIMIGTAALYHSLGQVKYKNKLCLMFTNTVRPQSLRGKGKF